MFSDLKTKRRGKFPCIPGEDKVKVLKSLLQWPGDPGKENVRVVAKGAVMSSMPSDSGRSAVHRSANRAACIRINERCAKGT